MKRGEDGMFAHLTPRSCAFLFSFPASFCCLPADDHLLSNLQKGSADGAAALLELMQGSFDSASRRPRFRNYAISLHMYPIWPERGYLYVEQALAAMQDKPYRQRVYVEDSRWRGRELRVQDSADAVWASGAP